MTLERVVHEALHEWSQNATNPIDLADAALAAGRRGRGRTAALAGVAVLTVAAAIAVPTVLLHRDTHPAPPPNTQPSDLSTVPIPGWTPLTLSHAHSGDTTVTPRVGESPPRHLIAAYDVAVSAWFNAPPDNVATYHLLNTTTGEYVRVPYPKLDVAPGLGLAAVLETMDRSRRIGLLDMATGRVIRWIATREPVGSVAFSPDGTKIAATTVGEPSTPDGIALVDLVAGTVHYESVTSSGPAFNCCLTDWTFDGRHIYTSPYSDEQGLYAGWFDADGTPTDPPASGDAVRRLTEGRMSWSPDGTRVFWEPAVTDANGHPVGQPSMENLQAWANNSTLVATECEPGCANEFINRLVAVNVDGTHIIPLTGYQTAANDVSPDHWQVLITRR